MERIKKKIDITKKKSLIKNKYNSKKEKNIKYLSLSIIFVLLIIMLSFAVTYAFFNFTKVGSNNEMETALINFDFVDNNQNLTIGNATPINVSDLDSNYEISFNIVANTNISREIEYRIYAIYGENEDNKNRLLDDVMTFEFIPAEDGNGFTTSVNNYEIAKSPTFTDGKALLSKGIVKNTTDLTTKTYKVRMWIDSDKILISSTTKRNNNAEGNPSMADTSSGSVYINRNIENDGNLVLTKLYPADSLDANKMVYTTNEFKNSYYSIKIVIEANDLVDSGN